MKELPDKPTLNDYQSLMRHLVVELGFDKETPPDVFMLLVEEIGELAKAMRKAHGLKVDSASRTHNLSEEAADVFWLLIHLCNGLNINLEEAFRAKEAKNRKRSWQ